MSRLEKSSLRKLQLFVYGLKFQDCCTLQARIVKISLRQTAAINFGKQHVSHCQAPHKVLQPSSDQTHYFIYFPIITDGMSHTSNQFHATRVIACTLVVFGFCHKFLSFPDNNDNNNYCDKICGELT